MLNTVMVLLQNGSVGSVISATQVMCARDCGLEPYVKSNRNRSQLCHSQSTMRTKSISAEHCKP